MRFSLWDNHNLEMVHKSNSPKPHETFFRTTIFPMRNSKRTVSNCWNRPGIARTAADCTWTLDNLALLLITYYLLLIITYWHEHFVEALFSLKTEQAREYFGRKSTKSSQIITNSIAIAAKSSKKIRPRANSWILLISKNPEIFFRLAQNQ